jgi:hypothetical protein
MQQPSEIRRPDRGFAIISSPKRRAGEGDEMIWDPDTKVLEVRATGKVVTIFILK